MNARCGSLQLACRALGMLIFLFGPVASPAAQPHDALPRSGVTDGLGVNIHFTDPRPGEMEMLAEGGFRWVRMDFTWGRTERERGRYDFAAYDRLMAALEKHRIRALFIFPLTRSSGHWGGAADGVIHFPLVWDSLFLLDNPSRTSNQGTIYIAAPLIIY